jgi:hypothetical protein
MNRSGRDFDIYAVIRQDIAEAFGYVSKFEH